MILRVVVDANVFVSALLVVTGHPAGVVEAWLAGRFRLVSSRELIAELEAVLSQPRLTRLFPAGAMRSDELFALIRERADIVTAPRFPAQVCRDPDDDRVLEAAMAGRAAHIVTGDKDLLVLGTFEDVRIIKPADFLVELPA